MSIKMYEYKKVRTSDETHWLSEGELNDLGADGWMLIYYNDFEEVYIFIREKK